MSDLRARYVKCPSCISGNMYLRWRPGFTEAFCNICGQTLRLDKDGAYSLAEYKAKKQAIR